MKYYNAFLQNLVLRRWTVLFMLAGILFLFRSMMTILLLTFIFTYLIYRLVETVSLGRENAFTLSGEPRREKLITILFNLDFLAPVCYHVATDTRRKEGL